MRWYFCGLFILVALCAFGTRAKSAPVAPAPNLLAPGAWAVAAPHPGDLTLQIITVKGAPGGGMVLLLTTKAPTNPVWTVQIVRGIPAAVAAETVVRMHFWARSPTSNAMRVTLEQSGAPYGGAASARLQLSPQWREFTVQGPTPGFGPNGLSAHFQVGEQPGVVEIAGITVTKAPPDPLEAAAKKALLPQQIAARIDKYRKGTLSVRVVDASGHPVAGAEVRMRQTRHAFLFGSNFFGLDPSDKSPVQRAYQERFTGLLNYATLPFYWGAYAPSAGHTDEARLQAMAVWCMAHGIVPKGHPLVWHEVWPVWAPQGADAAIPLLKARVFNLVPRFAGTIHYWDVLNEANSAPEYRPANGESRWVARDGAASVVATVLGWARAAAKENAGAPETFIYNDYDTTASNVSLLGALKARGSLPDVIGIQSHMHAGEWSEAKIWRVCETFARFHRPLHFTETTVISGPRRPLDYTGPPATDWDTTPGGEAHQAEYVARFYTILFSHPSVRAITWWDFSDRGAWLGAPAGLLRRDMSPKPAYTRLLDLIHHQWWSDVHGKASSAGAYQSRVFYGDYQVTVTDSKGHTAMQTVVFPEGAGAKVVVVRLGR